MVKVINKSDYVSAAGFLLWNEDENEAPPIDRELIKKIKEFIIKELWDIKSINYRASSYGIKHFAERYLGEYVAQGNLIVAMIELGYKYKRNISGNNCYFNVSHKSINQARKKIETIVKYRRSQIWN